MQNLDVAMEISMQETHNLYKDYMTQLRARPQASCTLLLEVQYCDVSSLIHDCELHRSILIIITILHGPTPKSRFCMMYILAF